MEHKKFFEGLDKETLVCARCGYCRIDCPVYQVMGWESSAPRARIKIARDLLVNQNREEKKGIQRIFECTFCGKCRTDCTTDIDTLEVWRETRKGIARSNLLPAHVQKMSATIQKQGNVTGDAQETRTIWLNALDQEYRSYIGKKSELLYFPGCTGSLYPAAATIPQSFVEILRTCGIDFSLLGEQEQCCGFPLMGCGEYHKGKEMILTNVKNIGSLGIKTVVTTCPSCYRTMTEFWPQVLEGAALPFRVMHASQLLAELIEERKIECNELVEEVAYHDPCDLGRNGGVFEAPRKVIKAIPGIQLKELKKNREEANCCGGGGNLEATNPGLAEQIALNRLEEVNALGVKTLVSCCQQCKRTLSNAARKNKMKIRIWDLTELVRKALKKKGKEV
ncbi:(Fe-S)-binding protein [Candidatus Formimonas warabiya]|uniref:4Fe-4S ferredoxin-type domain-containing protein n=1 Tax=Formimonas warabiya TaxID=1761012 RepID=A0A3G1KTY8_FORW1|nr:(Fe-S)-binding protein [Candidatus Formimonas warabiya]ATW25874.1 hypothetical protein DCMF_14825 [Candidatus Formimonas warabiya]